MIHIALKIIHNYYIFTHAFLIRENLRKAQIVSKTACMIRIMEKSEKIRNMSDDELIKFILDVSKNYMFQYYDMKKWLVQETYDPIYIGEDGIFLEGQKEYDEKSARKELRFPTKIDIKNKEKEIPCRIVEKRKAFGKSYNRIIVGKELMDVQARYVKCKKYKQSPA